MNYSTVTNRIFFLIVFCIVVFSVHVGTTHTLEQNLFSPLPEIALAVGQYAPTGGSLVVGTASSTSASNFRDWRSTLGNDANVWAFLRTTTGFDAQLYFDNVNVYSANKMLVTMESRNITTGNNYVHQICDWVNSDGVDNAASAGCTGGGWRNLEPQDANLTDTTTATRVYEIYDGYFSTRTTSPGAVASTPLSNFASSTNGRVIIRSYSTVNSVVQHEIDFAQVEVAIDPIYEPSGIATTSAGFTTNFLSDIIGSAYTTVTGSDNTRMTVPMAAVSTAADFYFSFSNVKAYQGANTLMISPEMCRSNAALTYSMYLYDFQNSTWTQHASTTMGAGTCTTDTDSVVTFNEYAIGGFTLADHISPTGEVRLRFLTNAPGVVYNLQFDRIYMMLGSVNSDSARCEISWGTGTASDCANTRTMTGTVGGAADNSWQQTSAIEYQANAYPTDNDDDATSGEYAFSSNLSFPIVVASSTTITGIHYAVKHRSNSTALQNDIQLKNYAGTSGAGGDVTGGGWATTPGSDLNALTTYSYYDTMRIVEQTNAADDYVDTQNNEMNMRIRTSASTGGSGITRDIAFAMMSVRWINEPSHVSVRHQYAPTGGSLVVGTASSTSASNFRDWRSTLGNDANVWAFLRTTTGFDAQLYFDNVNVYSANKMLVTMESRNITTGNNYVHQICDWVNSDGVDNAASAGCTGGGWRNLEPQDANLTDTTTATRVYEIYDGYFSTRTTSPGAVASTPLSNFASSTNGRVIIRSYSTVNSVVQHEIDFAQVEVAIDPIYEPSGIATTSAGFTTNFLSDIIGSAYTTVTGSDNTRMTVPMAAVSTAADFYFSFSNVKAYQGANTLMISPEMCRSNAALTYSMYLYDFQNSTWTQHASTTMGAGTCTTDTDSVVTFNEYAIGGFTLADHISPTGEVRLRFLTNAPGVVYNLQFDRIYMMLGSVNSDSARCEISWGTGTASDCANTRTMTGTVGGAADNSWQQTSAIEYQANAYPTDNDDDATSGEYAFSSNLSFPIVVASSTTITGIHYAVKNRSNSTALTNDIQIRNYAGDTGVSGETTGAGWQNTPGADTNAATTYSYYDTMRLQERVNSPDDYVDTQNNEMNMRIRTSASTGGSGITRDIAFAMMSVRYLEKEPSNYITMNISDTTIGFGALSPLTARYATGDTLGTSSPTSTAHTISVVTNAPGGYSMTLGGSTLTCSACTDTQLDPIGATATTSKVGFEQFGINIATSTGNGTTYVPYKNPLWAFDTAAFPDVIAAGLGDETVTIYNLRYIANIRNQTEAGEYTSNVSFVVTGTY